MTIALAHQFRKPAEDAEQFLTLLRKTPDNTWIRFLKPGGGCGPDRQGLPSTLPDGANTYLVIGNAHAATGKGGGITDADITSCPALFVEWDDGASIAEQSSRWQRLGLPEPSITVTTGGKSVHCYWLLDQPLPSPDQWRQVTRRLIAHCDSDPACSNPARVMRLPGSTYYDKRNGEPTGQCRILAAPGTRYSLADIEACLPAPATPAAPPPPPPLRSDLPPSSLERINAAAAYIPKRVPGNGTYPEDRNALCGCADALAAAGEPDPDAAALALLGHLWPSEQAARQVLASTTTRKESAFWAIAGQNGFDLRRADLKPAAAAAPEPAPGAPAGKAIKTFSDLIQQLPDGWRETENGLAATGLSAGALATMLEKQNALRFNLLSEAAEVRTATGWKEIQESDLNSAYVILSQNGWKIGAEPIIKAVVHVARLQEVHPVRQYLERISSDPTIQPYDLDQVARRFLRNESPLAAQMVRKWLIGAAQRALQPGCKMDYCLVLQGEQGLLKSGWFEALASEDWFTCTIPEGEKDFTLNVMGTWIYELAELDSVINKREAGRLKNTITTRIDMIRKPYGRTVERMPRQSVFGGTVNKAEFLNDETGDRRYWVVPITGSGKLDNKALMQVRDGIWKAAVAAVKAGELPMLNAENEARRAHHNEQFNQADPWETMVVAWMDGNPLHKWDPDRDPEAITYSDDRPFTTAEALYAAGLRRPDQITRADEVRLAAVLRKLKFTAVRASVSGQRVRQWHAQAQEVGQEVGQAEKPCAGMDLPDSAQNAPEGVGQGVGQGQNDCSATDLDSAAQPAQPKTPNFPKVSEKAQGVTEEDCLVKVPTRLGRLGSNDEKPCAAMDVSLPNPLAEVGQEVGQVGQPIQPPAPAALVPKPWHAVADDMQVLSPGMAPYTAALTLEQLGFGRVTGRQVANLIEHLAEQRAA